MKKDNKQKKKGRDFIDTDINQQYNKTPLNNMKKITKAKTIQNITESKNCTLVYSCVHIQLYQSVHQQGMICAEAEGTQVTHMQASHLRKKKRQKGKGSEQLRCRQLNYTSKAAPRTLFYAI